MIYWYGIFMISCCEKGPNNASSIKVRKLNTQSIVYKSPVLVFLLSFGRVNMTKEIKFPMIPNIKITK